ncbi:MAG TPA: TraB/GumN family protein [Verrucomicrobiae bacterium]|nr:TraB/GumN family protein [Verrucomicrobiae bacterium]
MKLKRIVALILLAAAVFICSVSAQDAGSKHPLWKVEGSGNSIYLLGSIHVLNRTNYPLATPILQAFGNSPIAVFETEMDKLEEPEAQQKIQSLAVLPPGKTLEGELSPAVFASFSNHVRDAGLPLAEFTQLKPFMAAMTLEVVELQKIGAQTEYGVDEFLLGRAHRLGKTVVPLETPDFQINLATGFNKQEGELLLKSTLRDIDNTKQLYGEMLRAWQTGDMAKLESMLNEGLHDVPVLFKKLVTDRTERWMPKIEELLKGDKQAIVIVGAGHLVGKQGLIELLKKKGWKITQL